jgi:antitoxin YefM
MIKAIKQNTAVGKEGKIEIYAPELPEGENIEVIILVNSIPEDTTEYLLSTEANKQQLLEAMERVKNQENLVVFSQEEWHEKYSI